jgi:hypothetical protein
MSKSTGDDDSSAEPGICVMRRWSTGNFLMLEESVQKFSADATRFALADAGHEPLAPATMLHSAHTSVSGDSLEDANFETEVANAACLALFNEEQFAREMLDLLKTGGLRSDGLMKVRIVANLSLSLSLALV